MEDRLMVSVSGVRGTIGGTLSPQTACDFGCAFAAMITSQTPTGETPVVPSVVIGRDTRHSGAMVFGAVAAGLMASGVNVIDLGVATTPGVSFMTRKLSAAGGVIITASHNPLAYNGIKFLQPSGGGFSATQAARLKEIWSSRQFKLVDVERLGVQSRETRTHVWHADAVAGYCDVTLVASKRFKVVVDHINGAGCVVTPMLLGRLGCEYAQLNAEPNGKFAHMPEPIEENLSGLCQAVKKHRAQVGFAQDPDADRLVIVDENGRFIGEEYTLALTAAFVLRHRKGNIATNLVTSRMLDDIAAAAGVRVVRAPTGEANVVEAMMREGCIFGGEGNGGSIDPRIAPVRNSLVSIAYTLQYMAETGKTISQLVADIPSYVMLKTKFACPAGVAPEVAKQTMAAFAATPGAAFNEDDGLRIDLPQGWASVRASNTEPIMRIVAEARDRATADALVKQIRQIADKVIAER
jgi:phosphomannomutase